LAHAQNTPTRANSIGMDRTGKWLPNSIHLLADDGTVGTTTTGPFVDCMFRATELTIIEAMSDNNNIFGTFDGAPLPNRYKGWVGAFGANGYNSVKSRIFVFGMNDGQLGFSGRKEAGYSTSGSIGSIFQRSNFPESDTRRLFDAVNSTVSGEGFPAPDGITRNVVITTDTSGIGLNAGVRDYRGGVSVTSANILYNSGLVL
jgi:hypothetical protein